MQLSASEGVPGDSDERSQIGQIGPQAIADGDVGGVDEASGCEDVLGGSEAERGEHGGEAVRPEWQGMAVEVRIGCLDWSVFARQSISPSQECITGAYFSEARSAEGCVLNMFIERRFYTKPAAFHPAALCFPRRDHET